MKTFINTLISLFRFRIALWCRGQSCEALDFRKKETPRDPGSNPGRANIYIF